MPKIPIFEGKIYKTAGTLVIPIPAKHHDILKKEGLDGEYEFDIVLTKKEVKKNIPR